MFYATIPNIDKTLIVAKVIKKTGIVILAIVLLLLSVPTAIWLVVQNTRVQTFLVDQATTILENKFGTAVTIGKFDYRPFNRLLLKEIVVEDLNGDTILTAETISANLLRFSSAKKIISLHKLTLDEAHINFSIDSSGVMNLTELVKLFISKNDKQGKDPFKINVRDIKVESSIFRLHRYNPPVVQSGVNFQDMHLMDLNLDVKDLNIKGDTISLLFHDASFKEKSGLIVDRFRAELNFSSKHMSFDKLRIQSMKTQLSLPYLHLKYTSWADLSQFVEMVNLQGSIDNSTVSTLFLSFFAPTLGNLNESVTLQGDFRGSISDLRLRDIDLSTGEATNIQVNANLTGLPDFSNTYLFVDIKNLKTTLKDIEAVTNAKTGKQLVDVPNNLYVLDTVKYFGNFTGFITDFVAFGTLSSAVGDISIDLSFKPEENEMTAFNGQVSTQQLDLGKLIDNPILGLTSLKANVKGKTDYGNHIEANTDATIYSIEANNYSYSNIDLSGNLTNKTYVGSLFLDDPNAKLNFMGKIDFSDTIPIFDFSAFVPKLDLVKLNLNNVDSISQASFLLTAKFSGNNIDNSHGEIKVVNCFYKNQNGEIKTSDITVNANNSVDSKHIAFKSEFAEGELRGKYNYANIFKSFSKLVYTYVPALSPDNEKPVAMPSGVVNPEFNDYIVRLRVRKTQKLTEVLFPNFRIAENTNVFGIYNPDYQTLTFKMMIPELKVGGNVIRSINIDGQTNDTSFVASISTPHLDIGGTFIRNIYISAVAADDVVTTSLSWDNKMSVKNQGEIIASSLFEQKDLHKRISVNFLSSQFFLNDTVWNISPSTIIVDSTSVDIDNFMLHNNQQMLRLSGGISSTESDSISVELENVDVSNINFYSKGMGYEFSGKIDGYAMVTDIASNPLFFADLDVENLLVNSNALGNLHLNSQWFDSEKKLSVGVLNKYNNLPTFQATGDIYPETKEVDFEIDIQEILINHFEPLLGGEIYGMHGAIAGNIKLNGTTDNPNINGYLTVNNAGGFVNFSKTQISMSDSIFLVNSDILFRNFRVRDEHNRVAMLNGSLRTNKFKDIQLDLNLTPNNFQFLKTTERDNELFYGTVYASGQARVTGPPKNLNVNVSVRTEPRTAIFLPLSTSSEVAEHDFLTFVNKDSEIVIIEDLIGVETKQKTKFNLTLDIQVNPEAEVQIIIDKQLGDIIRANGSGNLKMEINPANNVFNMFGQYIIEQGDYLFTLQGVINKRFRIGQGSTITWNGDVTDAGMDIKAIYGVRTTLSQLLPGQDDERFKQRTQVECHINLTGKLMEPIIEFDIVVPAAESDPEMQAVVQDALNTEERMSKQFLSLLVINNFTSDVDDPMSGGFSQGLASTASEMLSNQLSNWLSQWSSAFDIGLNYRPGDPSSELSSNELELAVSTQLFNDRVTIQSNVDMGNQNPNAAPLAGDFHLDVKIVPSGKLRFKVFARSNDDIIERTTLSQAHYTAGAGIMYREDFNSLEELWQRYWGFFKGSKSKSDRRSSSKEHSSSPVIIPQNESIRKNAIGTI